MWRGQHESLYYQPSGRDIPPSPMQDDVDNADESSLISKVGEIKSFYAGANVFITGGTGFLGKVVIEKLLRSCPDLNTIYCLMRPKKGLNSEQRFEEFQKHEVFNRIRSECPKVLEKLTVISGDMGSVGMGLSAHDEQVLLANVTVVFHVAATVKFNEDMKDAADLNTLGTVQIMELCSRIKHLKSVVHVSTAYCNPNMDAVEERVYETTEPVTKEAFLALVKALPKPLMNLVGEKIQGYHPNTYTLTKSMAEQLVAEYNCRFPICIVRPSIVTGSISEPCPGWIDNINGITGIMMEIGRGTISSIMCEQRGIMDLIPVDIVSNTIITAAWSTYRTHQPELPIKVLHCTSGDINPVLWYDYGRITEKWARINPSKYVMMYPNFSYRTNRVVHFFVELLLHFLPAILFDLFIRVQGGKPMMFKIAKRLKSSADTGEFFAMHSWAFKVENMRELIRQVHQASDGNEFNCDMSNMNWSEYVRDYMLGIRKFVLRDGEESLPSSRKKVVRLYWIKIFIQTSLISLIVYILYSRLAKIFGV